MADFWANEDYDYLKFDHAQGVHVLRVKATGKLEAWFANPNKPAGGISWRNTTLEFARSYKPDGAEPQDAIEHIEISFGTGNAAFAESPATEIARVLRAVARQIERDGIPSPAIYDSNGNFIGEVKILRADD